MSTAITPPHGAARTGRWIYRSCVASLCLSAGVIGLSVSPSIGIAAESRTTILQQSNAQKIQQALEADARLVAATGDGNTLSIDLADTLGDDLVGQTVDPVCRELNELARELGEGPVQHCGDHASLPYGESSPAGDVDDGLEESLPGDGLSDVVLLIHGFSGTSGHDCDNYWGHQKAALEAEGRTALIVGYYMHNTNGCDIDLSGGTINLGTPLEEIALVLHDWIVTNLSGQYVDIVAHSMGGLVTRKMLDTWGQDLLVRNVVTLGTPHGGVQTAILNASCALIYQCLQMSAGSEFIETLEHNPQSAIPTQWTLIAAKNDQVVGSDTGIQMDDGVSGGPKVSRHQYSRYDKFDCRPFIPAIGHGGLNGKPADGVVYTCNAFGYATGTVDNPHTRLMNAIN